MSLYTALTQVLAPFAAKIKGIQTGYDGTVYPNPGTAVREQIKDLHVMIGDEPGTAIQASAVAYNGSNVGTELTTLNERLTQQREDMNKSISDIADKIFSKITLSGTEVTVNASALPCVIESETASLSVTHRTKNLLAPPYTYTEPKTINGITYTVNEDGSIHAEGTATANSKYYIVHENTGYRRPIKAGTYTLSGCPAGGGSTAYNLVLSGVGQGNLFDYGNGVSFTISEDKTYYMSFTVISGQTVDFTFYPMIEAGAVKTEWVPYKSETITLEDGKAETMLYGDTDIFTAESTFSVSYYADVIDGDIINLKNAGAKGDGVTDDTAAINSALLAAEGKTLFVPEGTYLFSSTISIPSNTKIYGCGDKSVFKLTTPFALTPYSWRPEDEITTSLYKWPMFLLGESTKDCVLENFVLEGQTSAFVDEAEIGFTIMGEGHILRNVKALNINYFPSSFSGRVYNAPGEGFEVFKGSNILIEKCVAENCGYEGIGTERCENVQIIGCFVGDTNQTGIQIHRTSKSVRVADCIVDYTENALAGAALTFHANVGLDMEDIHVFHNYFCKGVTLIGGAENDVYFCDNTVAYGGLTRNGSVYRQRWFIRGNKFLRGGIVNQIDNCIITDNMLTVNTGYQMINMRGNNVIAVNNIPLGNVSGIYIETHDTE